MHDEHILINRAITRYIRRTIIQNKKISEFYQKHVVSGDTKINEGIFYELFDLSIRQVVGDIKDNGRFCYRCARCGARISSSSVIEIIEGLCNDCSIDLRKEYLEFEFTERIEDYQKEHLKKELENLKSIAKQAERIGILCCPFCLDNSSLGFLHVEKLHDAERGKFDRYICSNCHEVIEKPVGKKDKEA